ncbi:Uncharacterized protein TCM_016440 [Theobroma cacao]|uniref:Uncharacterized protein n=1 Tax=Theobroma cacao TaxID=3641 RepID=A0A061GD64_THECC|nr:Uncharacterized protein TCM_016440 [Theobroma cacao]
MSVLMELGTKAWIFAGLYMIVWTLTLYAFFFYWKGRILLHEMCTIAGVAKKALPCIQKLSKDTKKPAINENIIQTYFKVAKDLSAIPKNTCHQ